MTMFLSTILAQLTPEPSGDLVQWVLEMAKTIVEMFKDGRHGPAVAGIIMLVVFFLKVFLKDRLPKAALPWLAAGLGVMSAISMQLAALAVGAKAGDWASALVKGAMIGAGASGLWSLLGKKLVELVKSLLAKLKKSEPPAPPAQ